MKTKLQKITDKNLVGTSQRTQSQFQRKKLGK